MRLASLPNLADGDFARKTPLPPCRCAAARIPGSHRLNHLGSTERALFLVINVLYRVVIRHNHALNRRQVGIDGSLFPHETEEARTHPTAIHKKGRPQNLILSTSSSVVRSPVRS